MTVLTLVFSIAMYLSAGTANSEALSGVSSSEPIARLYKEISSVKNATFALVEVYQLPQYNKDLENHLAKGHLPPGVPSANKYEALLSRLEEESLSGLRSIEIRPPDLTRYQVSVSDVADPSKRCSAYELSKAAVSDLESSAQALGQLKVQLEGLLTNCSLAEDACKVMSAFFINSYPLAEPLGLGALFLSDWQLFDYEMGGRNIPGRIGDIATEGRNKLHQVDTALGNFRRELDKQRTLADFISRTYSDPCAGTAEDSQGSDSQDEFDPFTLVETDEPADNSLGAFENSLKKKLEAANASELGESTDASRQSTGTNGSVNTTSSNEVTGTEFLKALVLALQAAAEKGSTHQTGAGSPGADPQACSNEILRGTKLACICADNPHDSRCTPPSAAPQKPKTPSQQDCDPKDPNCQK